MNITVCGLHLWKSVWLGIHNPCITFSFLPYFRYVVTSLSPGINYGCQTLMTIWYSFPYKWQPVFWNDQKISFFFFCSYCPWSKGRRGCPVPRGLSGHVALFLSLTDDVKGQKEGGISLLKHYSFVPLVPHASLEWGVLGVQSKTLPILTSSELANGINFKLSEALLMTLEAEKRKFMVKWNVRIIWIFLLYIMGPIQTAGTCIILVGSMGSWMDVLLSALSRCPIVETFL